MKKEYLIPASIIILVAIFSIGAFLYDKQKVDTITAEAKKNESYLIRDHSPKMGSKNAKVTIVEFFDPACETCKAFHPLVKQLMDENPGKVNLVMRYVPLHQGSDYVVALLEAARLQNKFWETLEATFKSQSVWASHHKPQPKKLWLLLAGVNLDFNKAKADMNTQAVLQNINQDISDAKQLGVTKTPGYFVNGKPLINFGYKQLQLLVENEIKSQY
ncbi:MAG: thioredoxin domain-containing protein [Gammaproteobacteria bacterium]|nr:thioredoxin domain-containing protein [Gammaproteobacteria bacterium]